MRILILSDDFMLDSDIVGGATVATINMARVFTKRGHTVSVISASRDISKCGDFNYDGIVIKRIHSPFYEDRWRSYRSIYNIGLLKEVENLISDSKPDIVLAHTIHLYISYYSLIIAKRYAKKVFLTAHDIMPFYPGTFTEFIDREDLSSINNFNYKISSLMLIKKFKLRYNPFRNFLIRSLLNRIDGVITVSDALASALNQNGISVLKTIHNGIDVQEWVINNDKIDDFKNKFSLVGKSIVLFQGRLSGAKGGDLILNIMKRVIEYCPNSILLVAGNIDDYARRMIDNAKLLGISENIVFTGWLNSNEIKYAYGSSDIVVIPSVCFDSFPNGNLEAFASKKPVVVTCFGGSREIVKDNFNGFIVNPFNINLFAEKIIFLINNKDKAREFGDNGYRLLTKEFSVETMAENYLNIF